MNVIIENAGTEVLAVFHRTVPAVAELGGHELLDLQHHCQDLEHDAEFSVRTGAHIVRAAVVMELEKRKGT